MATVNLGRIKPVFRGAYDNSTAYVIDDIVTSGNETFIAIAATQGNATSDASKWTKLAAKGADGTDVGTTLTTQGDILFRDGSGLQRLAIGTANQILQVNSGATALEYTAKPEGNLVQQVVMNSSTGYSVSNNSSYQHASAWDIAITPTNANNRLVYTISTHGESRYSGSGTSGAQFKVQSVVGGTSTDISGSETQQGWSSLSNVKIRSTLHRTLYMTAGTTNQVTFKVYYREVAGNTEAWFGNSVSYAGNTFVTVEEIKV